MNSDNEQNPAVYDDARNMANIALWGIELQIQRLRSIKPEIEEFILQPVIDFHFLITALNRLRQSANLISNIYDISEQIKKFDNQLPDLKTVRNILEHIDEYRIGEGRNKSVTKDSFQTITFDDDQVVWSGFTINFDSALTASQELFSKI